MPPHLALLFRARRPIEPLRALHAPVYDNRPLQPLIDTHHAYGTQDGLLGHVDKEQGEAWLQAVFEDIKPSESVDKKANESKEETKKRI
jgi:hypothetical protein